MEIDAKPVVTDQHVAPIVVWVRSAIGAKGEVPAEFLDTAKRTMLDETQSLVNRAFELGRQYERRNGAPAETNLPGLRPHLHRHPRACVVPGLPPHAAGLASCLAIARFASLY